MLQKKLAVGDLSNSMAPKKLQYRKKAIQCHLDINCSGRVV